MIFSWIILPIFLTLYGQLSCYSVSVLFKKSVDNVVFTENIEFKTEASSAIDCSRRCVEHTSCAAFTFSQPLCQGHSRVMTSSDSGQTSALGAEFFVKCSGSGAAVRCRRPNGVQVLTVPGYGDLTVSCQDNWIARKGTCGTKRTNCLCQNPAEILSLVLLRRKDGSEDFYRNWDSYVQGFGNVSGEFWMGLEAVHRVTNTSSSGGYELKAELGDWDDSYRDAFYANFSVGPASLHYPLNLDFAHGAANDSMSFYSGLPFTTKDADHDNHEKKNCAEKNHGAWWYKRCTAANLFGRYYNASDAPDKDGITWKFWHGTAYSLKFAQLKMRPDDSC